MITTIKPRRCYNLHAVREGDKAPLFHVEISGHIISCDRHAYFVVNHQGIAGSLGPNKPMPIWLIDQ